MLAVRRPRYRLDPAWLSRRSQGFRTEGGQCVRQPCLAIVRRAITGQISVPGQRFVPDDTHLPDTEDRLQSGPPLLRLENGFGGRAHKDLCPEFVVLRPNCRAQEYDRLAVVQKREARPCTILRQPAIAH